MDTLFFDTHNILLNEQPYPYNSIRPRYPVVPGDNTAILFFPWWTYNALWSGNVTRLLNGETGLPFSGIAEFKTFANDHFYSLAPPLPHISRTITIDHTLCGSSSSSNFPVLVSLNDTTLKTVANGGHVANTNGFDILFYADSAETTLLNWEVEFYDGVAGILIAWVKIPSVSNTADTVFYMQYGNTSISAFLGGAVGSVWDSNYITVWHLPDGTTLSTADSTANAVTGAITGTVTPVAGQIDGGAHFADKTKYIVGANTQNAPHTTVSLWVNVPTIVNGGSFTTFSELPGAHDHTLALDGTTGNPIFYVYSGGAVIVVSSSALTTSAWHYLVGTADGTHVKIYIDGALTGTLSGGDAYTGYTHPNIVLGGDDGSGGSVSMAFDADEARYSKSARSADWILTEYNNQNTPGNIGAAAFLTFGPET